VPDGRDGRRRGSTAAKTFKFVYDATNTNKNTKLVRVTDPRGGKSWVDDQTWPLDWPMSCPVNKAPIKVLRLAAPPAGSWGSWNRPTW
jgi:hypothetical protein